MLGLEMLIILHYIVIVLRHTHGSHPAHLYTCSQRWTTENVVTMMTKK